MKLLSSHLPLSLLLSRKMMRRPGQKLQMIEAEESESGLHSQILLAVLRWHINMLIDKNLRCQD
jgi:hypothetical protein